MSNIYRIWHECPQIYTGIWHECRHMTRMSTYVLLIIWSYFSIYIFIILVAYYCYKKDNKPLYVRCPRDLRIQINEGLYVRSVSGSCYYAIGDTVCSRRIGRRIRCCGAEVCKMKTKPVYLSNCGYASFFRLSYQCLPGKILWWDKWQV